MTRPELDVMARCENLIVALEPVSVRSSAAFRQAEAMSCN
jgi:hypothetical protein